MRGNAKSPGKPGKKNPACKTSLHTVSDYSLSGFLNEEPDIYSDADLKISSPATLVAIKKSDRDIRLGRVKTIRSIDDLLGENP
ncbi:hypothetical protein [Methanoregula sp.]|uniref:hypothetical protein n=1 Tax=Methanoregula sp. TaxID=2052170 RepID=UPI003C720451